MLSSDLNRSILESAPDAMLIVGAGAGIDRLDHRVERAHRDRHVARVGGDARLAGPQDRM